MSAASRARLAAAVLVPTAVLAAACGSGNDGEAATQAVVASTSPSSSSPASADPTTAADGSPVIPVSVSNCGEGWHPTTAGEQTLTLKNVDFRGGEARVVSIKSGHPKQVFAEVEPFGPGTTVTINVRLGAGKYALACLMEDEPPITGPIFDLTGSAKGGPGVVPADATQLTLASWQYQAWVSGRLPQLVADTQALSARLDAHDLVGARAAWLKAHLDYETLGAAYDAFGDLDGAINGGPAGLPGGVTDPDFTGFHRIEAGLFGATPSPAAYADLARRTDALVHDVRALKGQLASVQLDPLTVTIRAHEITENLLQTQLTGQDDFGSHSDLATIGAGLAGTTQVLEFLHKQLNPRFAGTKALEALVEADRAEVERDLRQPWASRAVADWPMADRERVSAMVSDLSERLAPVASILEPRKDD